MTFQVYVADAARSFSCRADQTVLAAMSGAGQACVQVGCRSGGCGVCRVQVLAGEYTCGTMSHAQVCADDRARGLALACQLYPQTDLRLRAVGKQVGVSDAAAAALILDLANRGTRGSCVTLA